MSLSPGPGTLAKSWLKLARWARSRTFALSPPVWWGCLVSGLVVALLGIATHQETLVWIGATAVVASSAPSVKWLRLKHHRNLPLVVLARFQNENPADEHLATVHVHQVERRAWFSATRPTGP
jgi:hypothetical protein